MWHARAQPPYDRRKSRSVGDIVAIRQEILDALRTLTVRQRTILALRYFHDLSETQVADALWCSVGTVRAALPRGVLLGSALPSIVNLCDPGVTTDAGLA